VTASVRPATRGDVDQLIAAEDSAASRAHLRARWDQQSRGEALFLLAFRDDAVVGHTMLLRDSKYAEVRVAHEPAEINALAAYVRRTGVGTALIAAAEEISAGEWGRRTIGLAVRLDNPSARRLYERLGYRDWGRGAVFDEWSEQNEHGTVVRNHRDACAYLLKAFNAD
jgi:ribosomal protein S18 acetylase RimI-like enzyme